MRISKHRHALLLGLALWLAALLARTVFAAGETISRNTIAGGGWVAAGNLVLRGVIGQPVAGSVASSAAGLCSGLECGAGAGSSSSSDEPVTGLNVACDGPTELGSATHFTATIAGGTNVTYSWDFGDGGSDTGPTVSHTYGSTGTYTATVTASNAEGNVIATTVVDVADAVVKVRDFVFESASVTIDVGDTVIWQRVEGFHNVRADDGSFRLGEPDGSPGTTWTTVRHTFTAAGTVLYHCEIHGGPGGAGMSGTVIVQGSSSSTQRIYLSIVAG